MPISAADSINFALEHTKQQLFRPFRIAQWTKLAFVGLLAGELGANGCNRSTFQIPHHPVAAPHLAIPGSLGINPAFLAAFIVFAILASVAIGIVLMYVGSVMRFILFDSVVERECHIRADWNRRLASGWRYFVWKLIYFFLMMSAIVAVLAIPFAYAFSAGWLRDPRAHLLPLISAGVVCFVVIVALMVGSAVVLVLTKDFVIPQMALEGIDAMEGWRRLWQMMKADAGGYAAYIAMKIVLAIVVGVLLSIAAIVLGIMIALPSVGLGLVAVLSGKAAGLTWTPGTIALAVTVGCFLIAVFLYLVSLVAVPAIVFFPAYSIYFFASRYPRLSAALRSDNAAPNLPPGAAPAPA